MRALKSILVAAGQLRKKRRCHSLAFSLVLRFGSSREEDILMLSALNAAQLLTHSGHLS